ncbi:hypothetical protein KCU77_g2081, partial [Aureobasidium melanogenum]
MDSPSTIMESEHADMVDEASDTLSDVGDAEISAIDYARYHGLSKDYTSVYPLSSHILHSIPQWKDPDLELAQRPKFELPTGLDLEEKWTIDHQSALFLKQITSIGDAPLVEVARQKSKSTESKVEPLLLPRDPELEQRRFMRARHSRQRKGPPEILSEAFWQDDGGAALYWPDPKLPETLMEEIKQEKLQLGKSDILFLQQCISLANKPETQELDMPPYKKTQKEYEEARHTPPLLPCSSPFQFSVPDSPVARMPLATSPIDPIPVEIKRIEDSMDIDDESYLDGLSDISTFDIEALDVTYSHPPLKRRRPDDYKVEVPLSPALQLSPMKKLKMVTFSDELCIDIPAYAKPFPSEDSNGTDEIRSFFEQVIEPGAKSALSAINEEQLSQADSMLRAEVPAIDQRGPLPPWKLFARTQIGCQTELEAQQQLISMLKRETIRPREHWPGIGEVDGSMSCWRPFDMRSNDLPEEEIECDHLSDFSPGEPEDTTLGWKLDGLRTLDPCEDDDEEIEALKSIAPQAPAASTFSVSNSLHRFMQTYTGKACGEKPELQTQAAPENVNNKASNHSGEVTSCIPHPSLPTTIPLRTFVLSSTMFERRKLVKEIERLNAMTEYIERDFTSARMLRGLASRTSEADEADIIIAPGHGIMLTTLQKIMQKSLPGEINRNFIRERIVQLARRYERLVIMVHEDRGSDQQRPLDSRESGELVSLINFCAAQSHDIQVMYIPGDEPALATWIVASMIRYGLDDPEVHLLQDETSWEVFLRKAGMDVFAAQAVLTKLKAPDPMPTPSSGQYYGLPAFVMMDEAERLRRFGALFGGEKILRKVSMAIDGCWKRNVVAGDLER